MSLSTSPEQELIYRIDEENLLCEVNAAWTQFALANEGAAVMPERVLGRSLWDFIEDANIRELYRQMVRRARSGSTAQFDYRCDAPEWHRRFRMTIRATEGGTVEFLSELRWQEPRPRMDMLAVNMPRSESWVRVCGWCQNVALQDGSWVPVEVAVAQLDLLAEEALPRLTHGICPPCHSGMMTQLAPAEGNHGGGHPAPPPAEEASSADP